MNYDVPTLDAYIATISGQKLAIVWCGYCCVWHAHAVADGYRRAHCENGDVSPYKSSGYNLRVVTPTPAWVRQDFRRVHPRGRARI